MFRHPRHEVLVSNEDKLFKMGFLVSPFFVHAAVATESITIIIVFTVVLQGSFLPEDFLLYFKKTLYRVHPQVFHFWLRLARPILFTNFYDLLYQVVENLHVFICAKRVHKLCVFFNKDRVDQLVYAQRYNWAHVQFYRLCVKSFPSTQHRTGLNYIFLLANC